MSRTQRGLKTVLKEIVRSSERSNLFWWMFDHHDQLTAAARGRRMRWSRLCERFAALGLVDATGKPASIRTARETWRQVRVAVATARAHAAAQSERRTQGRVAGLVNPSRVSPSWRPQVVSPAPSPPRTQHALMAATDAGSSGGLAETSAVTSSAPSPSAFSTVGPDGQPLEPGWVFYEGRVMRDSTALRLLEMEKFWEGEDRFR